MLVGNDELDLLGSRRVDVLQHRACGLEDDIAAKTGRNAAEQHHARVVVELLVPRNRVREEAADLHVDLERLGIALLHRGLHDLETLGELHRLRELEAVLLGEPVDGLLRERHRADTGVTRPLVRGRLGVEVDRGERELGDAARERTRLVDEADGFGGTHRDAEDALLAHRDHTGESRDVAVVVDLERNAPILLDAEEHVLRNRILGRVLLLDGAEERGDAHLLADECAGRGTADRVDARKSRGGRLEALGELRVVVLGVGVVPRIPRELLGEHDLALVERRDLEVARAEVETDTATVGDGLHLRERLFLHGHLLERKNDRLDGTPVEVGEELVVELARALLRVRLRDGLDNSVGTGEIELPAARGPHDELRDAVDDMRDEFCRLGAQALRYLKVVAINLAILALPRNSNDVVLCAESAFNFGERHNRGPELRSALALCLAA